MIRDPAIKNDSSAPNGFGWISNRVRAARVFEQAAGLL
jgi:hypothetical protein